MEKEIVFHVKTTDAFVSLYTGAIKIRDVSLLKIILSILNKVITSYLSGGVSMRLSFDIY